MLSSALSSIRNKYEDARVSINETKFVAALIAAAPNDYLNATNTRMGVLEQDMVPVTVKEIEKEMSDLYKMQKLRNIKSEKEIEVT